MVGWHTGASSPPNGWAYCDGQLLDINTFQSLFSILGTNYGGDGRTTFALPDLRGRVPMHVGNGHNLGEKSGEETVPLTIGEMPQHIHTAQATDDATNIVNDMTGTVLAQGPPGSNPYLSFTGGATMAAGTLSSTGNGQGHDNMSPWLAIHFIIAITGVLPP